MRVDACYGDESASRSSAVAVQRLIPPFECKKMTSRAETWGVPLLLAFLIFLFFLGILVTNRYVIPWDAMSYYYPMTFFLVENLK